jgi:hypothetical protein
MKRLFVAALASVLWMSAASAAGFDHSAWDALLKQHVVAITDGHATQVDYAGMAKDRTKLKSYLGAVSSIPKGTFDAWPKNEQLAFLINAYNAYTVELILTKYPDLKSIKDLGSFISSPWKKKFIPLFGETISLDNIEQDMIRSDKYAEPRIHFAVNCASIGCPALRTEAYTGANLTAQLDDSTRKFLGDRSRNRLDGKTLEVSHIFKWYKGDFTRGWQGFNSVEQFFTTYSSALGLSPADVQKLKSDAIEIDYLDYNWNLNATKTAAR